MNNISFESTCWILLSCVVRPLIFFFFFLLSRLPPKSTLFPYTTLFRSTPARSGRAAPGRAARGNEDRRAADLHSLRSEEHTSELQSHSDLVCRLLLEKKKINI